MKKSAMLQAFRVLRDKPMVLLLIVPVQALSVLSLKFMPDMSGFFNLNYLMNPAGGMDPAFMTSYMLYMFISSMVGLVSLAAAFLLTPPAMELFADGAAGEPTEQGWYMRGLRRHWWKPIVSRIIVGIPTAIAAIGIYIVSLVLAVILSISLVGAAQSSASIEGGAMFFGIAMGLVIAGVILVAVLVIDAFFALFLPALADRSFGAAFKLLFSRKGLRKFFRALGGLALLTIIPSAIIMLFGALYIVMTGVPGGAMGYVASILGFVRSWTGMLAMLLSSLAGVVIYAFEFCLYQQVKDEEAAAQPPAPPAVPPVCEIESEPAIKPESAE